MDTMINIFRHFFIFRQTIFTIPFHPIFRLFDLIFHEFDKVLFDKVLLDKFLEIEKIYIIIYEIINDKNKQKNDNILNLSNLGSSLSYNFDDIIGSSYRKYNPKKYFSSTKSSNNLFKETCSTIIQSTKINLFENLSSLESQQVSTNVSYSCPKVVSTELPQKNDIQPASIEVEKISIPEKVEQIPKETTETTETTIVKSSSEIIADTKVKGDSISLPTNSIEVSISAPPKPENTDITTTAPVKKDTVAEIAEITEITLPNVVITSQEVVLSSKVKRLERATPRVPPSFSAGIPIDIFIEICYHLPPESLFSLMSVCKQFRFWLNSSVSYVTQDIWRTSRMKYLERVKLRPPVGMDELTYIKLTTLEQGCQFCGTRKETPKVYWAFRVRCCQECLKKRATRPENLPKWAKSPVDITMFVPYENIDTYELNGKIVIYWNLHLEQTRREYMSTPPKHRSAWMQKKQHWVAEMLKEAAKRERIDELYCRKQSLEDERIFRALLDDFRQIKDERGQQKYIDKYVCQLPAYLEAQNTWKAPFMTNPWPNFIDRLKIEYPEVMNKVYRLQQVTDTMLLLITSYVTLASDISITAEQGYQIYLTDPVIDCLQWCPSFINPPYEKNDASIPWTEEYLIKTLIPKLRKEARHLLKKPEIKRPGPFTTVRGCKNLIEKEVEDKEFFKCKLCWKSAKKLYNYEGICRHLTSGRHSIAWIDDERMIEVDREKVKKLLPVWFASFH